MTNGGQICTAHTRLIIHESLAPKVRLLHTFMIGDGGACCCGAGGGCGGCDCGGCGGGGGADGDSDSVSGGVPGALYRSHAAVVLPRAFLRTVFFLKRLR